MHLLPVLGLRGATTQRELADAVEVPWSPTPARAWRGRAVALSPVQGGRAQRAASWRRTRSAAASDERSWKGTEVMVTPGWNSSRLLIRKALWL